MNEVLYLMLPLAVSVIVNIALGMYYNIGTQKFAFDYKILLSGIIKASTVGGSFIGLAYVIDTVAIFPEETPQLIMLGAITLYVGKAMLSLKKILGLGTESGK